MIRWLIAVALGLLAAWFAYGRSVGTARSPQSALTWLLALLRGAAVTVVAALLLSAPLGRATPRAPLVAIDVSASWRRAVGDESTYVRTWRQQLADSVFAGLPGDAPVVFVGDSLRDASTTDAAQLTPQDLSTRLRPAVDRAASLGRSLVLVTDGEVDDADALSEAPPGSRVLRLAHAPRRDVGLADLAVPVSATGADTIAIAATVAAGGVATPDGTLHIRLDGTEVATAAVPALAPYANTRIAIPVVVPRGDRTAIVQAVLDIASDVELRNDTLTVAMDVGDKPTAVFVSTAPDIDVREVLTVLRGALDVPTRAYLRIAPNVWRVEGSLAPISEAEVKVRAAAAGMLIVHGDTAWRPAPSASATTARALWVPAPPTQIARAGELTRTPEWYAAAAPPSPLMAALSALPFDSLPPVTLAGPAQGTETVLTMRLGKRGDAQPAIATREAGGTRTVVISGSGYAGWSLRAGRNRDAFTALWGAIFDWVSAGRGDLRAARPVPGVQRAGEPVMWRRGGADSVVPVRLARRASAGASRDSVAVRFGTRYEATSAMIPAGVYDVQAAGGASVLVVNASREWVPRAPGVQAGPLARGVAGSDAPRLADAGWPFVLALLLLCAEWLARRAAGQR
ncbi:hypothetical protein [Gemmatimonas phototrophica]|uniref:Aerotolerance regulator N-terminal domain-containing protein n=1 Tax=Gemmatimonas phototrophica TaxID=1379270 RepID=A0A143BI99_9BACT|nr:hypothetical protein [Gemmatimonas phototrophica]AMW04766.1 hypothetical protein GEMMAAP_07810 [Gemmatimonas phototrophica]